MFTIHDVGPVRRLTIDNPGRRNAIPFERWPELRQAFSDFEESAQRALIVTGAGEIMVIANGKKTDVITRVLEGHDEGTIFLPRSDKMSGRKRWIAYSLPTWITRIYAYRG